MNELLREYLPILIFLLIAVGITGAMIVASFVLARQHPEFGKAVAL